MEEKEKKEPKPRGGVREGAGRKTKYQVKTVRVSVAIPENLLEIIYMNFPNRSDFIQKAIRHELRRENLL